MIGSVNRRLRIWPPNQIRVIGKRRNGLLVAERNTSLHLVRIARLGVKLVLAQSDHETDILGQRSFMLPKERGIPERGDHGLGSVVRTGKHQMAAGTVEPGPVGIGILCGLVEGPRRIRHVEIIEILVEVIRIRLAAFVAHGHPADAFLSQAKQGEFQVSLGAILDRGLLHVLDVFRLIVAVTVDVFGERAVYDFKRR